MRLGSRRGSANDVSTFSRLALPSITRPIYLVTTDGDCGVPADLEPQAAKRLLQNPYLIRWYTQNYDGTISHPKLRPLPIGLDLHTGYDPVEKLGLLLQVLRDSPRWERRENRLLLDLTCLSHREREIAACLLRHDDHVELMRERLPFSRAMREYARYRYAFSVRGNGLDCHRTWELLLLNTIPVVKTCSLDPLFSGLPVIVLQDWREALSAGSLEKWASQFGQLMRESPLERLDRRRFAPELFGR